MAGGYFVFSIYKTPGGLPQYFLLRTLVPDYSNWSQSREEDSREAESAEQPGFLEFIRRQNGTDEV